MSIQALAIKNLKKTYKNGFEALKGVNLQIEEGEFFALLGPNGAGKSTIIGIVSSLVNLTSGEVRIFTQDISQNAALAKQYIGVVPQEFNFNVFEPIEEILVNQAGYFGIERKLAFERAELLLSQLQLLDKRRNMARELSGGMKRRLMIARALMHQPRLLILDEPTAGVDIEIRHSMWSYLKQLNAQGTTIILTTHYLEEAERLCNKIAIIDQGLIVKHCQMKDLLNQIDQQCLILELKHPLSNPIHLTQIPSRLIDSMTMEVNLDKQFNISHLFRLLSEQAIEVLNVRHKSNRLEQLFLELVADKGNNV